MDLISLGMAKKFTEDTAIGLGAVKGAPATIERIEEVEGGNKVTFLWTGTNGTQQRQSMFVAKGEKGERGERGPKGEPGSGGSGALTDEEIFQLLMDMDIVQPLSTTNGVIYIDNNNKLYVL